MGRSCAGTVGSNMPELQLKLKGTLALASVVAGLADRSLVVVASHLAASAHMSAVLLVVLLACCTAGMEAMVGMQASA